MAEQDWLTPATAPSPYPQATIAPAYDLRPLTLGELLDRTFSLYRSRFWLFAGIAAVSGAITLVAQVIQLVVQHVFFRHNTGVAASLVSGSVQLVMVGIFFLGYSVTQAATVYATAEVYLGRTTTIGDALRATIGRWYVYAAISIWQYASFLWVPIVLLIPAGILAVLASTASVTVGVILMFVAILGGFPIGAILLIRNSLAIQAAVEENLKIRASMRRSKTLAAGTKGRIFVVFLIWIALYFVVGMVQAPLLFGIAMAIRKGGEAIGLQAVTLLVGFLGHSLVSPVALIGLSLVYFDQRVRREAFDIAILLGEPTAVELPAAPAAFAGSSWSEPTAAVYQGPAVEPGENETRTTDGPAL